MARYAQPKFTPPNGACVITLLRHGQTIEADPGKPFQLHEGQGDPPLSTLGVKQAEAVAPRVVAINPTALFVTPLQRTRQTIEPALRSISLQPHVVDELREIRLGDWEGGAFRQHAAQGHPAYLRARARQEWGEIPGAEASAAFKSRVVAALRNIASDHRNKSILVTVHGGVIGAAMSEAIGCGVMQFAHAENGSLTQLVLHEGQISVRFFNDVSHLSDL